MIEAIFYDLRTGEEFTRSFESFDELQIYLYENDVSIKVWKKGEK